jgi:hypothetical protein
MSLTAKRLVISAFVIFHVSAVGITNMPDCPLKRTIGRAWVDAYTQPTGLWQVWAMFAPDPAKEAVTLEAVVRDSRGLVRNYAFPRQMDESAWTGFCGGFRHAKYSHNLGPTDATANREFAARYVTRALGLKPQDYPADVQLVYQVWPSRPLDALPDQPTPSPYKTVVDTFHFPNIEETKP